MPHPALAPLLARKSIEALQAEAGEADGLRRSLGPWSLLALGVGSIVGAGLFTLTGLAAAQHAGPAVVLSFLVAAAGCALAGLCYSELAAMIPVSGSAYTYAYAALGELAAWIIGWDLVLEYAVGAATVAVSWSGYVANLLASAGLALPHALVASPWAGGVLDLPAALVVAAASALLLLGVREGARVNGAIVVVKLAVVAAVIGFGALSVHPANWHPFVPPNTGTFGAFGVSGVLRAAGLVFFAFIGFDAVSTAAQEAQDPQRHMPVGILGSLALATVLYVGFALVLTGLVPFRTLGGDAPVATALAGTHRPWLSVAVQVGILCGFSSVLLVLLLGQSRVLRAMAADGLLPERLARLHPRFRTPWLATALLMLLVAALAALVPLRVLGDMTSIGTLLAFCIVCGGVLVLRRTAPDAERRFRVPLCPALPALGVVVCAGLMLSLDRLTWLRLAVWLLLGLGVYAAYGRRHSRLRAEGPVPAPARSPEHAP